MRSARFVLWLALCALVAVATAKNTKHCVNIDLFVEDDDDSGEGWGASTLTITRACGSGELHKPLTLQAEPVLTERACMNTAHGWQVSVSASNRSSHVAWQIVDIHSRRVLMGGGAGQTHSYFAGCACASTIIPLVQAECLRGDCPGPTHNPRCCHALQQLHHNACQSSFTCNGTATKLSTLFTSHCDGCYDMRFTSAHVLSDCTGRAPAARLSGSNIDLACFPPNPTPHPTFSSTATPTISLTPSITPSITPSPTASTTPSPTATNTGTSSPTTTATPTPIPTPSMTPTTPATQQQGTGQAQAALGDPHTTHLAFTTHQEQAAEWDTSVLRVEPGNTCGFKVCGKGAWHASSIVSQQEWQGEDGMQMVGCGNVTVNPVCAGLWVVVGSSAFPTNSTSIALIGDSVTLSSEISLFTHLQALNLGSNDLVALPSQLATLSLTLLEVYQNNLTAVPSEIGAISTLTTLSLDSNNIASLPTQLGRLTRLDSFRVVDNALFSVPSELGLLSDMTTLRVANNTLTALPSQFGQLTALTLLDVSNNPILYVPTQVGRLHKLQSLYASNCKLGQLPSQVWRLSTLTHLFVGNNAIGNVHLGALVNLEILEFEYNQVATLPSHLGHLTALRSLKVFRNRIGNIPSQIGSLTNLTDLSAHGNYIAALPTEFGLLTSLRELQLHNNVIEVLPTQLGGLSSLGFLNIQSNALQRVPGHVQGLQTLTSLIVSNNFISQDIEELSEFFRSNMTVLALDNLLVGCTTELTAFDAHKHFVSHNCMTSCHSVQAQLGVENCMITTLVTTPRPITNSNHLVFEFQEARPEYRRYNKLESDTRYISWLYRLSSPDSSSMQKHFGFVDYATTARLTLPELPDGRYELMVVLGINFRAMDRCRADVEELFGPVSECDEIENVCHLRSGGMDVDCTFDDVVGRQELFEFTIDTVPPSVSIQAFDSHNQPLRSDHILAAHALSFALRPTKSDVAFTAAMVEVGGCGSHTVAPTATGMDVRCKGIGKGSRVVVRVPANRFRDAAGNNNTETVKTVTVSDASAAAVLLHAAGERASARVAVDLP